MARVVISDETIPGKTVNELTLDFLDERITVRELIRSRVYQEVRDYNARKSEPFQGLVQPTEAERVVNGKRLRPRRDIDWQAQYDRALKAFETNGLIILVDNTQVESLDEEIDLRHDSRVTFLRLVPLVGG